MKLIGSDTSPYVRKVRVVLAEKKIDYRYEREDVWAADSTIAQSNPLGKVPVLITDDGAAVFDSRVIVEYLDTVTPIQRLIPPSGRSRVEVRCWEALCDGLLDAAILARLEANRADPGQRSPTWIARQMGKIDASLDAMARGLADKPFCSEGKYSLADVAMGCALGYLDFRYPHEPWRPGHPKLEAWYAKVSQLPPLARTVPPG